jgi:phosphoglycolate phosphatase
MRTVDNVLLDLDGTLTDPKEGILGCLKHALHGVGAEIPPDRALESCIGPPLQDSLALLLGARCTEVLDEAIDLYRGRFAATGMFENRVYPGIAQALADLRAAGASLFVATSKPQRFAERILDHFALREFFRGIYGSGLDGTRSNKGDLIAHLLRQAGIPPDETAMVGDRAQDVLGARANGVVPIGALWGYGSRAELSAAGAEMLCGRPADLCTAVTSLQSRKWKSVRT